MYPNPFLVVGINLAVVWSLATLLWVFCVFRKDVSIIDRFWGPACALPGFLTVAQLQHVSTIGLVLVGLSQVWALRLAYHITRRNWGGGEDYRYDIMMAAVSFPKSKHSKTLVHVFLLQGFLASVMSLPLQLGQIDPVRLLGPVEWLGIAVWAVGFAFEVVGDMQLRRFKAQPANKGRIMDQGLWSWTRHPNYFGDATVWFGLFLVGSGSGQGLVGIISPIVMLYFLLKITGRDLLEASMIQRYPAYRDYMARTSSFFPLPPLRAATGGKPRP